MGGGGIPIVDDIKDFFFPKEEEPSPGAQPLTGVLDPNSFPVPASSGSSSMATETPGVGGTPQDLPDIIKALVKSADTNVYSDVSNIGQPGTGYIPLETWGTILKNVRNSIT